MVALNRDKIRRVVCGVDWGFTHPGALEVFGVDGDGRMFRIYEVYHSQRTIDWWIERAKEIHAHFKVEAFVADPSEPAYIQQFQQAGLPCMAGYNGVAPGIQAVAQRLVPAGDGRPRLFFLRDAGWGPDPTLTDKKAPLSAEDEMLSYVWDLAHGKKKGEEPVKESDHGLDACRYAVCYVDSIGLNRYVATASLSAPSWEMPTLW